MAGISKSVKRRDFDDKIAGKAVYTADLWVGDRLYAKVFRSQRQRAVIEGIELPELPEGYEIIDYRRIPGVNRVPIVYDDQPFLAEDRVNYIGEPILLAVGEDPEIIRKIMSEITVRYRELEAVNTIAESMEKPELYTYADGSNAIEYTYGKGDPDSQCEKAARHFTDRFRTGYQEHAYLETNAFASRFEDGCLTIHGSMQCPYYIVEAARRAFGLEEDKVRVIQQPTGGGFGGKEDYPSVPAVLSALAAYVTGRPVLLSYDREEDMTASTKRHPSDVSISSWLDSRNRITAMDIDVKLDGGAYAGLSSVVLQRAIFSATGVYNIENLKVRGRVFATNKVVSSAFRGFGGPQVFFAIEMHMENIALQLGLDPLAFKSRHFLRDGDLSSTRGQFLNEIKTAEMAAAVSASSGYPEKRRAYAADREALRGIGFSAFYHGCGFTGAGEADILKAKAKLVKYRDGSVEIFVSSAEIGQGVHTTLAKIVAAELELPQEKVRIRYADTGTCPDSGPTVASRTILIIGKMLRDAAREIKSRWDEEEIEVIRSYETAEGLTWDNDRFIGNAYPAYSWGVNVVEVRIDPVTFQVEVEKVRTVYDIGTPIDLRIIRGQIEGGVAQGLGYSLMEALDCADGRLLQNSLTTYIIPSPGDFPKPEIMLIDNPRKNGPFGASGLGELPIVGVAPAVASAVQNALGKTVRRIPITPEYVKELINREN